MPNRLIKKAFSNFVGYGGLYLIIKTLISKKPFFHQAAKILLTLFIQFLYTILHGGPASSKLYLLFGLFYKPKIVYHKTFVAKGYEPVLELFKQNFEEELELGAQCVAYVKGQKVVDLCAHNENSPQKNNKSDVYNEKTLQNVFSNSKTASSIVVALLIDKGLLDYDEKVSKYWPEFSQNGKENITLADVMRHEAGLVEFKEAFPMEYIARENIKKNKIGEIIEQSTQKFKNPAQSKREYHSITRCYILNEIVRRVDPQKRTIGEILQQDISQKFEIDFFIGVPENQLPRTTDMTYNMFWDLIQSILPKYPSWLGKKVNFYFPDFQNQHLSLQPKKKNSIQDFGSIHYKTGEIPSANGFANAEGMARLASLMAQKGKFQNKQLISEETWKKFHDKATVAVDLNFFHLEKSKFSQGGVNIYDPDQECATLTVFPINNNFGQAGWTGFGGAMLQWHSELELGFGYAPNLLELVPNNYKGNQLLNIIYQCTVSQKK